MLENLKIESEIGLSTVNLVMDTAASKANLYYWEEDREQSFTDPETGITALGHNRNVYKITENWYIKDTNGYTYEIPYQFTTNVIYEE